MFTNSILCYILADCKDSIHSLNPVSGPLHRSEQFEVAGLHFLLSIICVSG